MRAIARGGRVPGNRIGRRRVFRAEVGAVEFELDPPDSETTDNRYAGGDWHCAADGGSVSRRRDVDDQAAQQLRLGWLRRDQAPADHRRQGCREKQSCPVHSFLASGNGPFNFPLSSLLGHCEAAPRGRQGDGEAPNRFNRFAVVCWMRGSTKPSLSSTSPQAQLVVPAPNTHAPLGAW